MAVVIASNLRKELAGTVLFDGVSFSVERRDRVALSGPNGAGKTTLLRILAGETEKHGGELAFAKGTRVALHDQRPPLEQELTLREYVLAGARDLVALEEELRRLEQAMAEGDHAQPTLNRYAEAQARLEHAGGYAWRDRASSVVRGLGFAEEDLDRPLRTFSGGELTRASLARALGGDPDLLLLDEPTNHLDVANLEWLERELASLDAAVILVAHDRWFLEAVTTATLELEAGRGTFFPGPWHAWRREKAARMLHAQKEVVRVQADIARLERFVERFRYKKDKAKQAQAKLTHIDRLRQEKSAHTDQIALLSRRTRGLGFEFLKPARSGRTVVEADGLEVRIGDRVLLSDATFAIERRDEFVSQRAPFGQLAESMARIFHHLDRFGSTIRFDGYGDHHRRVRDFFGINMGWEAAIPNHIGDQPSGSRSIGARRLRRRRRGHDDTVQLSGAVHARDGSAQARGHSTGVGITGTGDEGIVVGIVIVLGEHFAGLCGLLYRLVVVRFAVPQSRKRLWRGRCGTRLLGLDRRRRRRRLALDEDLFDLERRARLH